MRDAVDKGLEITVHFTQLLFDRLTLGDVEDNADSLDDIAGGSDDLSKGEVSPEEATIFASGLSNVQFQLGEAAQLPFDDKTFDAVMSSQVFEYLDNVSGGLQEMYRVLRPGGRVLIRDTDWGTLL